MSLSHTLFSSDVITEHTFVLSLSLTRATNDSPPKFDGDLNVSLAHVLVISSMCYVYPSIHTCQKQFGFGSVSRCSGALLDSMFHRAGVGDFFGELRWEGQFNSKLDRWWRWACAKCN